MLTDRRIGWGAVLLALLALMGLCSYLTREPYDYQLPLPPAYEGQ